jgi:hypothetical protein
MTGTGTSRLANSSTLWTVKNTATPPQLHQLSVCLPAHRFCAARDRRQDQAADAVDLRSSLDPDPLPAFACTEPGISTNRSQQSDQKGLTRPHSFRNDRPPLRPRRTPQTPEEGSRSRRGTGSQGTRRRHSAVRLISLREHQTHECEPTAPAVARAMEDTKLVDTSLTLDGRLLLRSGSMVGAARIIAGDEHVELHVRPKIGIARLLWLLGYARDPRGWRNDPRTPPRASNGSRVRHRHLPGTRPRRAPGVPNRGGSATAGAGPAQRGGPTADPAGTGPTG